MPGPPSVTVKLDDGTGTFPVDISPYVRMANGVTWSRGRPDQYQTIGPGTLSLTLDNTTGAFTYGGVGLGFGLGPFGGGAFGGGGAVTLDQKIRLTVAGITRWTGRIKSAPVSWPSGGDEFSTVTITAIDDLDLAGRTTLRTSASHEILKDNPGGYYPCGEGSPPPGTAMLPAAGDVTGNPQMPALTVDGLNITPPHFGDTLNIIDESTGVTIAGGGLGSYLANVNGLVTWSSTNSIHFDIVFYTPSMAALAGGGSAVCTLLGSGTPALFTVNSVGTVSFPVAGITYAAGLTSLKPHVLSINGDATATDLWVDGVKVATGTGLAGTWTNGVCTLGGTGLGSMTLGHFNFGSKLTDARVLAHHNALLNDFRGETPTARLSRVAGYVGLPVGSLDTTSTQLMGPTQQAGRTALDVFGDVTDATQGVVFVDANGAVSNVSGHTIQTVFAPTSIIDANFVTADTAVEVDLAGIVNSVTGKASGSANQTTAINAASITQHGLYPASFEWNVSTDQMAADLTNWQIATYPQPFPRVPTLKHDVQTMQIAQVIQMLNLELGKLCRVSGMPSQTPPAGGDLNLIVQGLTETVVVGESGSEWSITVNGTRAALMVAWILEDTTFGKLDNTTKLSF